MKRFRGLLVALLGFALACGASAQSGSDRASGQINDALSSFFGEGGTSTVTPEQAAAVDDSVLTYQPDEAVSAQVRAQFADLAVQTGAVAPEDKQQLIDGLAQVTLEQQQEFVDSVFVGEGFRANNLADVVAMNVIIAYYMVLDLESTTTEQDVGVRDLFKVALSSVPEVTGMDNAQKQMTTETLMLALLATVNDLQQAQAGAAGFDMETVKGFAEDTLVGFGLAPCLFTLGPTGIEAQPGAVAAKTPEDLAALCPDLAETIASAEAQGAEVIIPGAASTGAATGGAATTPVSPTDTIMQAGTGGAAQMGTPPVTTPDASTGGANPLEQTSGTPNPLAPIPAPDPFAGTYSNDTLTLALEGGSGTYMGTMDLSGQTFPVQATANGNALSGTFSSSGATFAFTATLDGATLQFTSDGNAFTLTKEAPKNPLGN